MKMNKLYHISLFLLLSQSAAETFNLVCDTPLFRNHYRFDSDSQQVTKIGHYAYDDGNYSASNEEIVYNTVTWDTDEGNLVWVTYDYTQPDYGDVLYTNMRQGTILTIVFDLYYKQMTYTLLTRVRGRVTHYNSSRKRCYSE